jgi:ParB family transcriptional regulator, chromosome partitioning protein
LKIKNISVNLIDIANENVRKDFSFGEDSSDRLIKEHLSKFDLLQPVVVRFDIQTKRYKLLIGRRRFLALQDRGEKEIPAVITKLNGAEAEAASLFENLIRKDLSPLEKAKMVKKLVDSTKSGITGVSKKYGLPKSTISEWLSILTLPEQLQEKIENGQITSFEGIKIARQPKELQNKLASASSESLEEEMMQAGVKRGAPKGLLTVRLVFNPSKAKDRNLWKSLEDKAKQNGNDINDFVKEILTNYIKNDNTVTNQAI